MYLTPEKELYTIIQQYYSGKFQDIASLDLDVEFDFSNILYDIEAHFYKIRSLIELDDHTNASKLLAQLEDKIISNTPTNIDSKTSDLLVLDIKVLNSFIEFKSNGKVDAELLDSVDTEIPSLALVYKSIIQPDANISIASPDLDLEAFVFTLFSKDADNIDPKTISQFKKHYSDSLILDFAVSWLGLVNTTLDSNTNDADSPINLKNSYYFFDELTSSSNTDSAKNLINLLACQLKLGNIPESIECIEKLDTLNVNPKWTYSLLINKIALNSLTSNSLERNRLIEELKNKFPNSPYVHDLNEKSELFDSIVESYN